MNLRDLHEHLSQSMVEVHKEYRELDEMIKNAESEGIDYHDWPQYALYLGLKSRWSTYREIKELVAEMLNTDP